MQFPHRFGRYTLIEKIASGGTAEVYRAVHTTESGFSKVCAVKRLLPAWDGNDELLRMLGDEALALTHLQHQAIVRVFDYDRSDGVPYIAMEFVDGTDCARLLARLIRKGGALPAVHALYIMSQVLVALEFAHRSEDAEGRPLGIVHRDISPSNILLSWNGEVKVTDFGIAKGLHQTHHTAVGELKGKYAYMAPEQARGEAIDARADLFACGVVLLELLAGRRLFCGRSDIEILDMVRSANLPEGCLEKFPPEIRAILMLALAAKPCERYQRAEEMLSDIARFVKASGEIGSSLALAGFLRKEFGEESRPRHTPPPPARGETGCTQVMAVRFPSMPGRRLRLARAAVFAILLSFVALIPPAKGAVQPADANVPAPASMPDAGARPVFPPTAFGAIAIDSRPSGASGTLSLNGKKQRITTPFALEGIDIGDGIKGRVEISAAGFGPALASFEITQASPAFAKSLELKKAAPASLSVNARPWGLVSVAGYASGRETPVAGLRVKAGLQTVRVTHPPSGRTVEARVAVAEGEAKRCFADFGASATIICR